MDGKKGVGVGILSAEKRLRFDLSELCFQLCHFLAQFKDDILTFSGQFEKGVEIFHCLEQPSVQRDISFKLFPPFKSFLGFGLIGPKRGFCESLFQLD